MLRTIVFTNDEKQKREVEKDEKEAAVSSRPQIPSAGQANVLSTAPSACDSWKAEFMSNALMRYRVPLGVELVIWRHTGSVLPLSWAPCQEKS